MMRVAAVLAAVAVTLGLILGVVVFASGGGQPAMASTADICITTGPLRGLTPAAASNARVVTAVAERSGGTQGAVIAVMVGITESGLRALGNSQVDTGGLGVQGMGSNHDSLGIFQQRASWGTAAQRLDPSASTQLFMRRLIHMPNWRSLAPWVAAQAVQASAWDGRPRPENNESSEVGGNYHAKYVTAAALVPSIEHDALGAACGALHGGLAASTQPGSHGLPAAYRTPADATAREQKVVTFAIAQLDKPYVFAAAGPNAFDCSGLVMAAWATVGVHLPHDSAAQARAGVPATVGSLAPGDLVLVAGDDGTLAAPGHVGIYLGAGLVINAADEQIGIRVQTYRNFVAVGHGLAALRHLQ